MIIYVYLYLINILLFDSFRITTNNFFIKNKFIETLSLLKMKQKFLKKILKS